MKLYRPATILVGVVFVLVGGLTRLATPDQVYDEQNIKVVSGTIGQALDYAGSGSTVKVTRIKFARSVLDSTASDDDKPLETNGIYLAIEWDAVRGVPKPDGITPTLMSDGGSVYVPVQGVSSSGMDFPDAGFAKSGTLVFEVNPADMKGLTLKLRSLMIFNVYNSSIQVDLGIPTEAVAQQMVDTAAPEYVVEKSVTRVES
ncbi:hypothetical protein [Kribbella solani]|uniref:DUF4352 domain-containing protein n=1 Tax=Kribbella solani TaxID=236067 RepID=A0A841DS58_9ACTN|nr:hypothetical protein [Kribbella solani]MBB5981944.1 hypothetical protein [Kribbella solani]MDX3001274.1 hypothetical protein [Kribbella solani]